MHAACIEGEELVITSSQPCQLQLNELTVEMEEHLLLELCAERVWLKENEY